MEAVLQHSPAQVIGQLLQDIDEDWPVFVSGEPSAPDETVTVYDTLGTSDDRIMEGMSDVHHGLQIRVRSMEHKDGFLKASSIRSRLSEIVYRRTVTLDSVQYLVQCVSSVGPVLPIGKDVPISKRSLFTLNFKAVIVPL